MADPKRSGSAMFPLIIIGAILFGFGVYQSGRPKDPEVNQGYVAPAQNPRTIQAPDNPPIPKDAAQRAAEEVKATQPTVDRSEIEVTTQTPNDPWVQGIMTGAFGNFRAGVLKTLKAEQTKGDINCSPVLTNLDDTALGNVEKIACTAKNGGQIKGEFDEIGEGEFRIDYLNGGMIEVTKSDGDFKVETRNSQ
jgi:hypothetical protein